MNTAQRTMHFKSATAILTPIGDGTYWLRNVYAKQRRQGHGTQLMKNICHLADRKGITIILSPRPYGPARETSMNAMALAEWYGRFGFVVPDDVKRAVKMIRLPKKG